MFEDQDPRSAGGPEPRLAPVVREGATSTSASAVLRRSTGIRVAIVALLLLVLAVPIAMGLNRRDDATTVFAAGASAAPQASAKSGKDPDKAGADKVKKPKGGPDGLGRGLGPRGLGPPGLGGAAAPGAAKGKPIRGPITISAIDGSSLSLKTDDGWTRTITVTSATTIMKNGQAATVSDLEVGDEVTFRETRNADGSYTVTAIAVPTPTAAGEVSAISGDRITIKAKGGSTRDITVTASTLYKLGPNAGAKSDVKVGSKIAAQGTVSGDTFTATTIRIGLAHAGGVVTGKTADTITVERPGGTQIVIHISGSTTFKVKGNASASLADIAVGDRVQAQGSANSDGSLDAVAVHGGPAKPSKDHPAKPKAAPKESSAPG